MMSSVRESTAVVQLDVMCCVNVAGLVELVGTYFHMSDLYCTSPGPNDLSLFQPKCPETHDLASKLYVYYHAKVWLKLSHNRICTPRSQTSNHNIV